jgi:hydroxymethylglutaryl-CoA lyase
MALDPGVECACHLHDTYGLGMANAYAAMRVGVKYFEAAFGGLGGCPFTRIAGGNLCTEDFVHMIQRMGYRADIRLESLIELTKDAGRVFGREMAGRVWKSGPVKTVATV